MDNGIWASFSQYLLLVRLVREPRSISVIESIVRRPVDHLDMRIAVAIQKGNYNSLIERRDADSIQEDLIECSCVLPTIHGPLHVEPAVLLFKSSF